MSTDHPEVKPVFRPEVVDALKVPRITTPYFRKYEYVALMAARPLKAPGVLVLQR